MRASKACLLLLVAATHSVQLLPRRRLLQATAAPVGLLWWRRPGNAMWQLWTSDDMEFYVAKAVPGDAASVLRAMDKCAETSWMMNMGPAKGEFLEALVRDAAPRRILEIGTFLGYMTIRMARSMPPTATLTTIEVDRGTYDASSRIRKKALPGDVLARVDARFANASDVIGRGRQKPYDFVLMDHWKPDYARDLETLRRRGLLADGAIVVADNVLFPGAPELLAYLGVPHAQSTDDVSGQACLNSTAADGVAFASTHEGGDAFSTTLLRTPFEYRPETPDALTISTYTRR